MPTVLAIESSCDNSSICIMNHNRDIIFYKNFNQDHMIATYGGYVPKLVADGHIINFQQIISELSSLKINNIDYIAICCGPGLIMSLNIGYTIGIALSVYYQAKVVYIDHIEAHMWSHGITDKSISFKDEFLSIMMSGGHSIIANVKSDNVKILAKSTDDAPGEILDKIAFSLKINPPNGRGIEINSTNGKEILELTRLNVSRKRNIIDFYSMSFSGIKTRVLNYIAKNKYAIPDICLSLQILVYNEITRALRYVLKTYNPKYISCVGGVMSNNFFKSRLLEDFKDRNTVFVNIDYACDNAVMIAYLAHLLIENNINRSSCCYTTTPYDIFIAS